MSQIKGQDKSPGEKKKKNLNGEKQSFRKRIQNNDSDDPGSWENNGEDVRNVYQRPTRTKEQTEVNTLEGINSMYKLPLTASLCLSPQIVCNYFILL